jgi:hypothetical protein
MSTTPRNNVSKPSVSQYNVFRSDMFGRTKISTGFTVFDSTHRYKSSTGELYSDEIAGVGAAVTYDINKSTDFLTVGTASGSVVSRESKRVFPYQPGKALQVLQSFVMAPPKTNLRQRVGYFGRQNGVYLEQDGTDVYFVLRSFVTGEVSETRVPQSEWNMDSLDGTGPSDVVLDLTKSQLLWSEYEWLGVGSARIGFAIDGAFIAAHQFNHANHLDSVYMSSATLPVRYEIENTGATASASSLQQICTTVINNGGYDRRPPAYVELFQATGTISVGTTPVILVGLRLAPGREDSVILPGSFSIVPTAAGIFKYELIENAAITGGTWVTDGGGNVQLNKTITSVTGGRILRTGILNATNQAPRDEDLEGLDKFELQLGRTNSSTPVSDTLVLVVRTLSGNSSLNGSFSWYDIT